MNNFTLVRRNLFHRKARTVLTIVSIAVGFALFGLLTAILGALTVRGNTAESTRLIVANRVNFTQTLPYSYLGRVALLSGPGNATPRTMVGGYLGERRNPFLMFAVAPEAYLGLYPEVRLPDRARRDFLANRSAIVVGKDLAERFGWKVGDRIQVRSDASTQAGEARTFNFTVAGVFPGDRSLSSTHFALFNYDYLNEGRTVGRDRIGSVIVRVTPGADVDALSRRIDAAFNNAEVQTRTATEEAFNRAFAQQLGDLGLIVSLVSGAAFLMILLVAANTMTAAARERTRQIATMKAIGFTQRRIFSLMFAEAASLIFLGGLIGLLLAKVLTGSLRLLPGGIFANLHLSSTVVGAALAIMAVLSLLTGGLPAWRISRVRPAEAFGRG